MITLRQCTCEEYMKDVKEETFDLIIADPPYYRIHGDFDFQWKTRSDYQIWIMDCLREFRRILKPTGTVMLWGGLGKSEIMIARIAVQIEDENLFLRQNWITQRNTRGIGTKRNYMSAREDLLFLTKSDQYTFNVPYTEERSLRKDLGANGKPRKNIFKRVSNVWYDIAEASQSSKERCAHPTVKALKLCDRIIQTHSNEGDLIYVPFAGSGSELISAFLNNRNAYGSEVSETYCSLAKERFEAATGNKLILGGIV